MTCRTIAVVARTIMVLTSTSTDRMLVLLNLDISSRLGLHLWCVFAFAVCVCKIIREGTHRWSLQRKIFFEKVKSIKNGTELSDYSQTLKVILVFDKQLFSRHLNTFSKLIITCKKYIHQTYRIRSDFFKKNQQTLFVKYSALQTFF